MLQQSHTWTPDNHTKAVKLWSDGSSITEIAAHFSISRSAVAGYISRNRDFFATRKQGQPAKPKRRAGGQHTVWSEERIAQAAEQWREGRTMAECAETFGVTIHAFRMMMYRYRPLFPLAKEMDNRPKFRRVSTVLIAPADLDALFQTSETKQAADGRRFILSGQRPVAFASLSPAQCKFPLSAPDEPNGPAMPCCGAPRAEGRPYCAAHAVISRQRAAA